MEKVEFAIVGNFSVVLTPVSHFDHTLFHPCATCLVIFGRFCKYNQKEIIEMKISLNQSKNANKLLVKNKGQLR